MHTHGLEEPSFLHHKLNTEGFATNRGPFFCVIVKTILVNNSECAPSPT